MSLILSGSNGVSDIDGDASTPAIRGTDANSGVFFGVNTVSISTDGTAAVTVDSGQRTKFPTTIGVGGATPATSGSGITFPATASASSDANTLDDYEEGTFGGNSANDLLYPATSGSITMLRGNMAYTRIGRVVSIRGEIQINSISSPVGALQLKLPFNTGTSAVDRSSFGGVPICTYNVSFTGVQVVILVQGNNDSFASINATTNGGTFNNITPSAGQVYWIDFNYFTA
jgi:hypothetical protein